MVLKEFVRGAKLVIDSGAWTDKAMPKNPPPFILLKKRGFRLGNQWRWRMIELSIRDAANAPQAGRVLVAYQREKQEFFAIAGVDTPKGTMVLARFEYHYSHPGWHAHCCCSEPSVPSAGRMKFPDQRRLKRSATSTAGRDYLIDDKSAVIAVENFFGLSGLDPLPPDEPEHPQKDLFNVE